MSPRARATPAPARLSDGLTPWLWGAGGALCFWSFGYTVLRGSDLWWHVASGRYIVETGSLFLRDPWSYTHYGETWLHHEWLADVIYHVWSRGFGLASLAVWKWGMIVATYGLLQRTLGRGSGDALAGFAGALGAVALAAPFLDIRPHLYSLLGTSVLLAATWRVPRPPAWLPLLFLVWANLHGGFLFGLLALGLLLAPGALGGGRRERLRAALVFGACAAVGLVNPHTVGVYLYPLRYAFDASSPFRGLGEWLPPFEPGGIRATLYPWALGVLALSAPYLVIARGRVSWRDVPWQGLGLAALTLAMSLTSRRFVPLFGMALSLLVAPAVADGWRHLRDRVPALLPPAVAVALGLLWLLPYPQRPSWAFHYLTAEDGFPVDTVNFVRANGLSGKVFAYYNWGGYLHLHTGGALRVYIDGRADTVFDAETYRRYLRVLQGEGDWIDVVESSGAEFFLWPTVGSHGRRPEALFRTGRWGVVYSDTSSVLLVRRGVALPSPLAPAPDTAWRSLTRAFEHIHRNELGAATRLVERALEQAPYLRIACHSLVDLQVEQGNREAARESLERCDRIYPDAPGSAHLRRRLAGRVQQRGAGGRPSPIGARP